MNDPLIFICKRGSITQPSKIDLRKAGVIVVEVDHPADCQLKRGDVSLSVDALLPPAMAALASRRGWADSGLITDLGRAKDTFVDHLNAVIQKNAEAS